MKYFNKYNMAKVIVVPLLLWPVSHALAGTVYGEVSGPNGVLMKGGELEVLHNENVLDSIHIKIKPDGTYQIFLPKGL